MLDLTLGHLALALIAFAALALVIARGRDRFDGPFVCHHVIDGDTIIVARPQHYRGRYTRREHQRRIRLLNIDTPESVKPDHPVEAGALEAAALLRSFLPAGARVYLAYGVERHDRYGRTLAAVYLQHPKGSYRVRGRPAVELGEQLALHGLARAISIGPNVRFAGRARAAQARAQRERVGLWGAQRA